VFPFVSNNAYTACFVLLRIFASCFRFSFFAFMHIFNKCVLQEAQSVNKITILVLEYFILSWTQMGDQNQMKIFFLQTFVLELEFILILIKNLNYLCSDHVCKFIHCNRVPYFVNPIFSYYEIPVVSTVSILYCFL
jgi:hypothetical protein